MKFLDEYVLRSVQIESSGHLHGAMLPGGIGEAKVSGACGAELGLVASDYDYSIHSTLHVRDEAALWFIAHWTERLGTDKKPAPLRVRITVEVVE